MNMMQISKVSFSNELGTEHLLWGASIIPATRSWCESIIPAAKSRCDSVTRHLGLVKCQRISILLLGNCARISQTFGVNIQIFEYISAAAGPGWIGKYTKWRSGIKTRAWKHKYLFFKLLFELLTSLISTNYLQASININLDLQYWYVCKEKYL